MSFRSFEGKKILIIDDDLMSVMVMQARLELDGFQVYCQEDPLKAVESVGNFRPDLVLLDMVMPATSGYAVLREMRKFWSPSDLPVLMLSSSGANDAVLASMQLGANDYLIKVSDPEVNHVKIEMHLHLKSGMDSERQNSEYKSRFLAQISHEIRTPLNAMMGMIDLLKGCQEKSERDNYIDILSRSGDTLLSIINDVLDMSKIESGEVEIESIEFDVIELVYDLIEMFSVAARRKGIRLVCGEFPDLDRKVIGDPSRLRQVLTNLLSNAVKFTHHGEIVLSSSMNTSRSISFRVSDTGIGIPEDKLDAVLESFKQADTTVTREYGGTGLGLSIAKNFVELMGGSMEVASELGKGTTFTFKIPFQFGAEIESITIPQLKGAICKVIGHCDIETASIQKRLEKYGAVVSVMQGVAEARQVIQDPFDLLFLDVRLGNTSSLDFLDSMDIEDVRHKIILLLPSGGYRKADVEYVETEGLGGYMPKPVTFKKLGSFLARYYQEMGGTQELVIDAEVDSLSLGLDVLIVDDFEVNRNILKGYLAGTGCNAYFAENGQEAVDLLKKRRFDMIFMDAQMPVLDGMSAIRMIRENEAEGEENIIIGLTANAFAAQQKKMLEAGCDVCLSKPIRKVKFLQTVTEFGKEVSRESLPGTTEPVRSTAQATFDQEILADLKEIELDHPLFFEQQTKIFFERATGFMRDIDNLIAGSHIPTVVRSAHALGGSAGLIGATRLCELCAELENTDIKRNFSSAVDIAKKIKKELELVRRDIHGCFAAVPCRKKSS